jgi:NAD(P)-dependent dehydrogenase (short-subunit alcohol dehydrogenase family)
MTILVTGAAGGIGKAIATTLAARGDKVIGQDVVPGSSADPALVGDLCDPNYLRALMQHIDQKAPDDLTAVVAAHGVAGGGRINEITRERAGRIMTINFESVIRLWNQFRAKLEARNGTLVVIVSQAGLVGEAGNGLYCASKFALAGWMRGLEQETSVKLRALHPGGIRTPLLEKALHEMAQAQGITFEELNAKRYGPSPAGRIADPREIGDVVATMLDLNAPGLFEMAITGGEVLW